MTEEISAGYSKALSASGQEKYDLCPHLWGLDYVEDPDSEPDVPWTEFESATWDKAAFGGDGGWRAKSGAIYPAKSKSTSLGKAVHSVWETHWTGGKPDWHSWPGQVAKPAIRIIPRRESVDWALVEVATEVDGIPGTSDLILGEGDEIDDEGGSRYVISVNDWKTCKDFAFQTRSGEIVQAHKPESVLRTDRQVARYTITILRKFDLDEVLCRWIYMRTDPKKSREARATVWWQKREDSERVFADMVAKAKVLQGYLDRREVPQERNPEGCEKFAGCHRHVSRGGTCDQAPSKKNVRINISKEQIIMAVVDIKAQIAAARAAKEAAAKAAAAAPAEAPAPAPAPAPTQPEPQPEPEPTPAPVSEVKPAEPPKPAKAPKAAPAPKVEPKTDEPTLHTSVMITSSDGSVHLTARVDPAAAIELAKAHLPF